jgi:alkanesulfonate monooxygenase SsuD/methylene tetrahydromethanopterin reductase-like flavin-dependent oxidoreductase (luciferase family)
MSLELGVYSFGNTPRTPGNGYGPTAQAVCDVLEAVKLAEDVGLDFFGFGEHHTRSMPLSSPASLVTAAAASTGRIKLGTTVTVLSTDEPLRVFQQLATAAAIAPGRIEVVAGRGSSAITFPLFDLDERDYDMLYASKLELLLAANASERVTWSGPHRRRPLQDALIVPRPEEPLKIWLGSGGSPESVGRAVQLGVPLFLGILGGTPEHWAQYGHAYRNAWAQAGHATDAADIAVAVHGFVGEDNRTAKATYLEHELRMFATGAAEVGRPADGTLRTRAAARAWRHGLRRQRRRGHRPDPAPAQPARPHPAHPPDGRRRHAARHLPQGHRAARHRRAAPAAQGARLTGSARHARRLTVRTPSRTTHQENPCSSPSSSPPPCWPSSA